MIFRFLPDIQRNSFLITPRITLETPIQTLHLFPALNKKLIALLRSLSKEDWHRPTLAKLWTVKDIAAHLLDTNFRTIATIRDTHFGEIPDSIHSYQDLVNYLNQLNADWVKAMKRVSPQILTDLLEATGKDYVATLKTLDPSAPALFSVAWAGQEKSPNWFHIAREYTEKWHHQQQIREAVNKQGIMSREFFYPLIETFMQALPYTYRNTASVSGTIVQVEVTGEIGGDWFIEKQHSGWTFRQLSEQATCSIRLDPDTAWKLFTKGITSDVARSKMRIEGDTRLASPLLSMVSVMA